MPATQARAHNHSPSDGIEHRQFAAIGADDAERPRQRLLIEPRNINIRGSAIQAAILKRRAV